MAEGKKSFIMYVDIIHNIEHLTYEEKGILFQHLLEYVNDLEPVLEDRLLLTAWKPIEMQLKRDLKKYETYLDKQIANGKKGGRPKAKKTQITQPFLEKPKKADSVNDNVSVNVNVNEDEGKEKNIYDFKVLDISEFKDVRELQKYYLNNLRLMNALSGEPLNKIKFKEIPDRLETYTSELESSGRFKETFKEYSAYFKNWIRTRPAKGKATKDDQGRLVANFSNPVI